MNDYIVVIGGGLAGTEAAYQIAKKGIKVKLYEMKPKKFSPAHSNKNLAEIVCSNSFKSNLLTNACGLLKEELRILDSLLIKIADETSVPAGQALAVDREKFSERVTQELEKNKNIEIIHEEFGENGLNIKDIAKNGIVIIATGPLTSDELAKEIKELTGDDGLHFYDAAAPIVEKDTIDMNIAFWGDRYEQERGKDEDIEDWKKRVGNLKEADYINLPMNKEEYENFVNELINAEVVELHKFEKREIFEGCMPIEIMAKRGIDTLRFGPLKPVGFTDPRTGFRPYAVVQLRQDNKEGTIYNIVGFQTNLKFGEQKRVFSMIPGLKNADFVKYGVMHRNTYINSPELLDGTYNFKKDNNIFFAGQITGVEGYVESISSGLVAGINACLMYEENSNKNKGFNEFSRNSKMIFDKETMIGALADYISTENKKFQPMNANFGILPELDKKIKDKKERYNELACISVKKIKKLT
ncbi:MAG: methylenetetrahydrofolate--tRNA-(uracil(54)-C(5))-methyltransferase (FADH(2)-oxidizing) TrmFO [Clostridiales bacterium]|nr:methylenetetrahydrofolate--tRNA-(uracil(54)-C(5))-methyltransferase (FADH(2)-oxidizing) TrmFO [Clostridiales bacterium]